MMNSFPGRLLSFLPVVCVLLVGCGPSAPESETTEVILSPDRVTIPPGAEVATFGAGCFWCVEEVFHLTEGVHSAVSGYMGGKPETANYDAVSRGGTDHAEVVQVHFDPQTITYEELLEVFFQAHDPTQLNRQGPDIGRQYRSVVFAHSDLQRLAADQAIERHNEENTFGDTVVTEVAEAMEFYPAEDYHQDFARKNPAHRYIEANLDPKLEKLELEMPGAETE